MQIFVYQMKKAIFSWRVYVEGVNLVFLDGEILPFVSSRVSFQF